MNFAPAREPTAMRVLKRLYAPAPASKTSSAKADRKTGKLKPKVPMNPTRVIVQISSGRPAT
ncbi:hypothetical protein STENM327S_02843 [Streptomyces tendae]